MKFATKTIHAGQPSEPETGALVAPIFQTSTYEQESPGHDKGFSYSRTNNPTRQRLEGVLAELEGVAASPQRLRRASPPKMPCCKRTCARATKSSSRWTSMAAPTASLTKFFSRSAW